jgi:hypothetical protein
MHLQVHLIVTLLLSFSRPATAEASGALARVCRDHGLLSRYCRPFPLPACSFARLDRLVRRQETRQGLATRVNSGRLRRSAFIPAVSAEWGRTDLLDVSSTWRPGETLSANEDLGQRNFWKVRATWDLRGLAFDPRELALGREDRARRVFLQERLDRTRRLYYQWLHEVLELRRGPDPRRLLACEELEAALDALTSGAFSKMLPSGP